MQTAEQLDIKCAKVGTKLHDVASEINNLFQEIDKGPEISGGTEESFHRLGDVRKLVDVASNIFPYPTDI